MSGCFKACAGGGGGGGGSSRRKKGPSTTTGTSNVSTIIPNKNSRSSCCCSICMESFDPSTDGGITCSQNHFYCASDLAGVIAIKCSADQDITSLMLRNANIYCCVGNDPSSKPIKELCCTAEPFTDTQIAKSGISSVAFAAYQEAKRRVNFQHGYNKAMEEVALITKKSSSSSPSSFLFPSSSTMILQQQPQSLLLISTILPVLVLLQFAISFLLPTSFFSTSSSPFQKLIYTMFSTILLQGGGLLYKLVYQIAVDWKQKIEQKAIEDALSEKQLIMMANTRFKECRRCSFGPVRTRLDYLLDISIHHPSYIYSSQL